MATVQTPLQRLPWFIGVLLSGYEQEVEAVVHVTEVVFEPKSFQRYRQSHGISDSIRERPALLASSVRDLQPLLEAAFADWIDFALYLSSGQLALAADHDEWTRIFARRKAEVTRALKPLIDGGVEVIEPPTQIGTMPRRGPKL
jgi:hypothetical protein